MGTLTETMMRLRGEIGSSHQMRSALRADLVRQTAERRSRILALCAGFARERAAAHRAWFGLTLAERQSAERRTLQAEKAKAKLLAEEAKAKLLAEEAKAKLQAEEAKAKLQAEEAKVKRQAEEAKAKLQGQPQKHEPAARMPHAQKDPFKGPKKY